MQTDTNITVSFMASQPLNKKQVRYIKDAVDAALQSLPGEAEDLLDVPEYVSFSCKLKQTPRTI